MITHLDYKGAVIQLDVTTLLEEQWRVNACEKEPWTIEFIEAIPGGSSFIDVGANVGAYTLVAVSRGLNVLAIEPYSENYAALIRNLMLNDMTSKPRVICAAVGRSVRWDAFHIYDPRSGSAHHVLGGGTLNRKYFHVQQVPVWTLDALVNASMPAGGPYYIKLDSDGTELEILQGAPHVLSQTAGIMLEMAYDQEEALVGVLKGHGLNPMGRWHERNGKDMGLAYGLFTR